MPPKTRGGGGGRGRGAGGDGGGRGGSRGGRGGGQQQSRGQQRTVSQAQPGRGRGQGHGSRSVSQPVGDAPPPTNIPPVPSLPQMTQQAATVSEAVQDAPQASVQRTRALAGAPAVDLPPRPGYGTGGRPVNIFANHYRLVNIPAVKIFQYAFTIPTKDGDVPTKGMATSVWEGKEVKEALGEYYKSLIFNGRAIAWGPDRIHNIPTIEVPRGKTTLQVNFTYATEFTLSDLTAYINKKISSFPELLQCLTFLNQVIADSLTKSSRYMAVGRKYFPTDDDEREISRIDDFSLLEFRKGFYQAIHWGGTNGLTINVNVTTGIFWNSQMHTVIQLALRTIGKPSEEGIALTTLNEHQLRLISRNVRGLKFFIKYRGPAKEKQVHMATGVSKETARGKTFDLQGQITSVAAYYQKTYNVRLRYPDAPLVKKGENFFPMELCYIVPLQRYPQKLDGNQAAAMIRFASKTPDVRKKDIDFKVRALNWANDPTLKRFKMNIDPQMASIPARILPSPQLTGGSGMAGGSNFQPNSGKWDLRGYRLKNSVTLTRWGILVFDDKRRFAGPGGVLPRFVQTMCQAGDDYGMTIDRNPVIDYGNFNASQQSIHRDCEGLYNRVQREKGGTPELLMFIIKGKNTVIYEHVKQFCDNLKGVQSQAVDGFNVQRKGADRAYHANLLLKVNTKLGGTTVSLKQNFTDKSRPTMFIGADVSHPAPGSKAPSLATMVGSVDHEGVRYACPLPLNQNNREESITGVRNMVTELVNIYKKNTNTYPTRVMYFRDGVAEGQFAKVRELEVTAIKEAVASMSGTTPTVTAIVVRKRNHTRFFPRDHEGDRSSRGNVYPGTVVDRDITHPCDFDFFPHSSIQGTARPAHYYVIHDDHKLPANLVQQMCYDMSYVYQRSSGSVSLHPAVYYAHLAGNRARAHDPSRDRDDDSASGLSGAMGQLTLDPSVTALKPLHTNIQGSMWWM